jgi:hypothetical protein
MEQPKRDVIHQDPNAQRYSTNPNQADGSVNPCSHLGHLKGDTMRSQFKTQHEGKKDSAPTPASNPPATETETKPEITEDDIPF